MKPAAVLGFDPAPGNPAAVDGVTDALHRVLRGLVMGRRGLDAIGNAGSAWDGETGAPLLALAGRALRRRVGAAARPRAGRLSRRRAAGRAGRADRPVRWTLREMSVLVPVTGQPLAVLVTLCTPCLDDWDTYVRALLDVARSLRAERNRSRIDAVQSP